MHNRAHAIIDSHSLQSNFAVTKNLAPRSKILAMLKSNAYGHGSVEVSRILSEADGFGVACIEEAIKLRDNDVKHRIVLLSGPSNKTDLELAVAYSLDLVIHESYQLELLEAYPKALSVWLKIDSGMHRLGFSANKFEKIYEQLRNNPAVKSPIYLMTHLASADDVNKETTSAQIQLFKRTIGDLTSPKSIANSAGIIAWPEAISDWNRPGLMLYGCSPMIGRTGSDHGLSPVMTLTSKIIAIHDCQKGDAIGYGGTWVCPSRKRIAVVAIGYGDGYPRHAKNGTPTLIRGNLCPLVGRVSMDMITVDVTDCRSASIEDEVILWGVGLPAETVAKYADTVAYELLCNISQRVHFIYK